MRRGLMIFAAMVVLTAQLLPLTGLTEELKTLLRGVLEDGSLLTASVRLELGAPEPEVAAETAGRVSAALSARRAPGSVYASGRAEELPAEEETETREAPPVPEPAEESTAPEAAAETMPPELPALPAVLPTTIAGGVCVTNDTSLEVDTAALLAEGLSQRLPADAPQILIIHTHGTEAYTPAGEDLYVSTDAFRTTDNSYNVIRVGDELAEALQAQGLNVIHDRGQYDYPSYTGSYGRSGAAVESWLSQYPDIAVVIDLHRDALGTGDVVYKTVAELDGETSAQLMLLVGTGENGLSHPGWRENLKLALRLQSAMDTLNPTLARPVAVKPERYNQHLTAGSLILEVGSNGNTLQEALCAIRLFAQAAGPVLRDLVE